MSDVSSVIPLSRYFNIRDLGGMVSCSGKTVRYGKFIRSCDLNLFSDEDVNTLLDRYTVRTIIDLRTNLEIDEKPSACFPDCTFYHCPLFDEEVAGITRSFSSRIAKMRSVPNMPVLYSRMVTGSAADSLKRVFQIILSSEKDEAVLFHCTAGKDRTGIVSAILLLILGVDRDAVIRDYLYTNDIIGYQADEVYEKVLSECHIRRFANKVKDAYLAKPEYLLSAFSSIDRIYGSFDAFVHDRLGISDSMRQSFCEKYLDDPSF